MNYFLEKYETKKNLRQLYFELALTLISVNQFRKAIEIIGEAKNTEGTQPQSWELYLLAGDAFKSISKIGDAFINYIHAVMFAKEYKYIGLGQVKKIITPSTSASVPGWLEDCKASPELLPLINDARKREWEEVESYCKEAIESLKTQTSTISGISSNVLEDTDSFIRKHLYKDALRKIEEAISKNPSNDELLFTKARILIEGQIDTKAGSLLFSDEDFGYLSNNDNETVVNTLRHILEHDPNNGNAFFFAAFIGNLIDHDVNEIKTWIERAEMLGLKSDNADPLTALYILKAAIGKKKGDEKEETQNYSNAIRSYLTNHEYKKALSLLETASQTNLIKTEFLFLKIQTLIEGQENIEEGERLFENSENGYLKLEGKERVIERINEIISQRPNDGNAFFFSAFIGNLINYDITTLKTWIDEADILGLKNDNAYPSTALYILKANIAEKENDKQRTGQNYFEAAKNYYYQGAYDKALDLFTTCIQYTPEISEAYVYCADLHFIRSHQAEPPYIDERKLENAYVVWHKRTDVIPKSQYEAWHYIVISRIHESYYKLREQTSFFDYWLSVLYAERALIHNESDGSLLTYLARFYRNLDLEINSLAAFEAAEALKNTDDVLAEEKMMLYLNMGHFEAPLKYFETLKQNNKYQPYHKTWEGFIAYNTRDYTSASNVLEQYLIENKQDLFAHNVNMHAYWLAYKFEEAKKSANEIIVLGEKYLYLKEAYTFAWAYFILGRTEKAIEILEESKRQADISNGNPFSLAQFYLYDGRIDNANTAFETLIKWAFNSRVLRELFLDLASLYAYAEAGRQSPESLNQIRIAVESWQAKITEQIEYIRINAITPEMELQHKLEELHAPEGSIPFITLQAGLARLNRKGSNISRAYAIYSKLLKEEYLFPEAGTAINQMRKGTLANAETSINNGNYKDAISSLQNLELTNSVELYQKHLSLAFSYYAVNQKQESINNLRVLFSSIETDEELQRSVLHDVAIAQTNLKLTFEFVQFVYQNRDAIAVSNGNFTQMVNTFALEPLINNYTAMYPVVTPIAVEISSNLSEGADSPDWYVIKDLVPKMRDEILKDYGVKTPGIRFRTNEHDLPLDTFIIVLDEIPIIMSTVRSDKLFVHAPQETLSTFAIEGHEATHPASREKASWVDESFREILEERNITFWDKPFQYIISFIQVVLSSNLDVFIDSQFCDDYLLDLSATKDVKQSDDVIAKAKAIRENPFLLTVFSQTLKVLVKEQVSIANRHVVVDQFFKAKDNGADVNDIVQGIRLSLKNDLPVNRFKLTHLRLPLAIEGEISNELITADNKTFLAMLPEKCQETLSEVRNEVGNNPEPQTMVLLINDPNLRIHVRRLAELEFPNLLVASREELTDNQVY